MKQGMHFVVFSGERAMYLPRTLRFCLILINIFKNEIWLSKSHSQNIDYTSDGVVFGVFSAISVGRCDEDVCMIHIYYYVDIRLNHSLSEALN